MKNWATLEADENRLMNEHYSAGRSGRKINKVIIHHNAGNLTIKSIWGVWQTRQASAHYQVDSNGRIGQLAWDRDTAWHAGNWEANTTSIGIEHADISSKPWRISDSSPGYDRSITESCEVCLMSLAHQAGNNSGSSTSSRPLPGARFGEVNEGALPVNTPGVIPPVAREANYQHIS